MYPSWLAGPFRRFQDTFPFTWAMWYISWCFHVEDWTIFDIKKKREWGRMKRDINDPPVSKTDHWVLQWAFHLPTHLHELQFFRLFFQAQVCSQLQPLCLFDISTRPFVDHWHNDTPSMFVLHTSAPCVPFLFYLRIEHNLPYTKDEL